MQSFLKRRRAAKLASLPRPKQMEIVCVDCAGDDVYPNKTTLTTAGTCAGCGGRSFMNAAKISKNLAQHLGKQKEVNQ